MDDLHELAMFPLGSVLFPAMPLPLRVFEPRYLALLQDVLAHDPAEFGVVLIERGQEVGGGDQRFTVGTVARVGEVTAQEDVVGLLAEGGQRFEVVEWLGDDPYPRANVRLLPGLEWDDELTARRAQTESLVRRTLTRASEIGEQQWSPDVQLVDDAVSSLWQLAAIAPIGPLDQVRLLQSPDARTLLDAIFVAVTDAAETLEAWS